MSTKQLMTAAVLCGSLITLNLQAQGLYIGLGGGYGFKAAKQSAEDQKSNSTGSVNTTEYISNSLSLGKGINAGLFVGYMFNKNMGAELGISYLIGGENLQEYEDNGPGASDKSESSSKGKMIRLTPCIRMTIGESKMRPYAKIGLIVGVGNKMTQEVNFSSTSSSFPSSNYSGQQITEYTGGISLGFHGGIGVNYAVSDKLSIFGEIAGNYQNWAPQKNEITTYTFNGVDQLSSLKTNQIETEYVDSYTTTNTAPDVNSPNKSTKFYLPFSSIGINIGVVFTMGAAAN